MNAIRLKKKAARKEPTRFVQCNDLCENVLIKAKKSNVCEVRSIQEIIGVQNVIRKKVAEYVERNMTIEKLVT